MAESINVKSLFFWFVLGIAGLAVFIVFFGQAFPLASIDVKVSKQEAANIAADFIKNEGFDLEGFDQTVIFYSDFYDSAYLQKTQGIGKMMQFIKEGVPVWIWRVRWFKELEKEGFVVAVDPSTGEIVRFNQFLLETKEGANLTQSAARKRCEEYLVSQGFNLENYEIKDLVIEKQKNRTDHTFVWEKKDYKIKDATLRIEVRLYGDSLGKYVKQLKVPEKFRRYIDQEIYLGKMMTRLTEILKALMAVAAVFLLVFQEKEKKVNWKFWLICGLVVMIARAFNFINHMPLLWSSYADTMSKTVFIVSSIGDQLMRMLSMGLMVFAYGLLGEFFARKYALSRSSLYDLFCSRDVSPKSLASILIVGYSVGFIFLGYATLFYLIGTKFFSVWIYPNTVYSNVLGTTFPFLFPLALALGAAIHEEFAFRLFAIPFLKKILKFSWLAVLISALLWGYAHSFYLIFPVYVRGIELTLFGILLGIVFLRYGIATVIVAHFVIDAVLAGLPLLSSKVPYFVISGYVVIALAFIPLVLASVLARKNKLAVSTN